MLAAITVLVTAVGASGDGEARAIEHALRSSLAADDVVIVRTDAAAAAEPSEPVDLTAVVTWSEDHGVAHIHFTRVADGRWLDREIRFDPSDAAPERGRTIGLALASMVPAE